MAVLVWVAGLLLVWEAAGVSLQVLEVWEAGLELLVLEAVGVWLPEFGVWEAGAWLQMPVVWEMLAVAEV